MTREEVEKYIEDYRQAEDKAAIRSHATYEYLKWKAIRDRLKAIDIIEHLERQGCIINIREHLSDEDGNEVTSIEIIPDAGWVLEGYVNNRLVKRVV